MDDLTPPAQSHSDTSLAAAHQIAGVTGRLRREVYEFLAGRGDRGATDEEIQTGLAMPASTERPRRVELVESGVVVDSGDRRPTASGRAAVVWRVRAVPVAVRVTQPGATPSLFDDADAA